jgi:hypothetical protein
MKTIPVVDKNGTIINEGDIVTTPSASSSGKQLMYRRVSYNSDRTKCSIEGWVNNYTEVVGDSISKLSDFTTGTK